MRIRKIVSGTAERPRMTVFRSNKQIYVQFIDDLAGVTLATASSKEVVAEAAGKNKCEVAALVGALAAKKAIEKARSGGGPTLIECKTYRWLGHWTGDPQPYRTREEVEEWKKKDPIMRHRTYLIENGIATAEELDALELKAQAEIDEAEQFALNSPEPDPAKVMDDVFYTPEVK